MFWQVNEVEEQPIAVLPKSTNLSLKQSFIILFILAVIISYLKDYVAQMVVNCIARFSLNLRNRPLY